MPSLSQRPQPGRRRRIRTVFLQTPLLTILLILTYLLSFSSAYEVTIDVDAYVNESPEFRDLVRRGEILTDPNAALAKRQEGSSSETATSSAAIATTSTSSTSTSLPSPFDTSLGNNFTSSACPSFINSFVANSTFKSCLPVSLLLQNSNSFFQATRSAVELSMTLDAACGANLANCGSLMTSLATQMLSDSNCGQDYRDQNPLVEQAYAGLVAYEPIYNATCIKNPSTGNYCFADAITNATNPSDSYPYYTALGIQLPGGITLSCNKCLQETMAIYALAATNKTQPVSVTYVNTAQVIDVNCGPTFVNSTIPVVQTTSGTQMATKPASYLLSVAAMVIFLMAM